MSWKIILRFRFGVILGDFYEEMMFRGVIQNHLMEFTDNNVIKSIVLTVKSIVLKIILVFAFHRVSFLWNRDGIEHHKKYILIMFYSTLKWKRKNF